MANPFNRIDLMDAPEDALIGLLHMTLTELRGRYRPTPQNAHISASLRILDENLADLEKAKELLETLAR